MDAALKDLVTLDSSKLVALLKDILGRLEKQGTQVELVERAQKGSTITINNLSTQAAGLQVESDAHGKAIKDLIAGQGKVAAQADETAKKVDDCAAKRDVDELRNQLRALMEAQQNQARKEQIRDDQMRGLLNDLDRVNKLAADNAAEQKSLRDALDMYKNSSVQALNEKMRELEGKVGQGGSGRGSGTGSNVVPTATVPAAGSSSSGKDAAAAAAADAKRAALDEQVNTRLMNVEDRIGAMDDKIASLNTAVRHLADTVRDLNNRLNNAPPAAASTAAASTAGDKKAPAPADQAKGTTAAAATAPAERSATQCQKCPDDNIKDAVVHCDACNMRFCGACDGKVHDPPAMRSHRRTPLGSGSARGGVRSRGLDFGEGSGGLDQEAAEALVNNIVAPLAQRIAEFGQMLRETQRDLVDSNGNVTKLRRLGDEHTDAIESLRKVLSGRKPGADDGKGLDGAGRDYLDLKLSDFQSKLNRLEHEYIQENSNNIRKNADRVAALERDKADKKDVTELRDKINALQRLLAQLLEEVNRLNNVQKGLLVGNDCQHCNEGKPAAVRCRDCAKRLCADCDRKVHDAEFAREHVRVPLNEDRMMKSPRIAQTAAPLLTAAAAGLGSGVDVAELNKLRQALAQLEQRIDDIDNALNAHMRNGHGQDFTNMRNDILQLKKKLAERAVEDAESKRSAASADSSKQQLQQQPVPSLSSSTTADMSDYVKAAEYRQEVASINDKIETLRQMLDASRNEVDGVKRTMEQLDQANAKRAWVEMQIGDLAGRIKKLEKTTPKTVRVELKKFERDILVMLDNQGERMHEASAARVHFRCLSCDSVNTTQPGPESQIMYNHSHAPVTRPMSALEMSQVAQLSDRPHMVVERGDQLTLHGRDGQVYKGRDDGRVLFSPPSAHNDSHFTVAYKQADRPMTSGGGSARSASSQRSGRTLALPPAGGSGFARTSPAQIGGGSPQAALAAPAAASASGPLPAGVGAGGSSSNGGGGGGGSGSSSARGPGSARGSPSAAKSLPALH